jgi:hypothetical protein
VISHSLGTQNLSGLALWGGHVDLEASVAGCQSDLYPIGIEAIYIVVDEEDAGLGTGCRWARRRCLGTGRNLGGHVGALVLARKGGRDLCVETFVAMNDLGHREVGLDARTGRFSEAFPEIRACLD